MVCGAFPFRSWGLVGMQEKEKACELCCLLVITRGAKWQAIDWNTSGALGWAWEFHSEDCEIRKCQGGKLLNGLGFCWPGPGSYGMRDEEGMWLPEPPNKEECHLSPSHPSVNVSHQSNSPHTISGTPNMVLKGSRTSSELSGTLGNISFIFQYAFSPLNFFFFFFFSKT